MKTLKHRYQKTMLISLCLLTMSFGQSLFNRALGTDAYIGSARSAAMGNTDMITGNSSGLLLHNPAGLARINSFYVVDYQYRGGAILERHSIDMLDTFGDFLHTSDYVSNRFGYSHHQIGLISGQSYDFFEWRGAISLAPLTSFEYEYEEEVRGDNSLDDGIIGIKDPLAGYQIFKTNGTLHVLSAGAGLRIAEWRYYPAVSIGLSIHRILESKFEDRLFVDTIRYDETYLASTTPYDNSFNSSAEHFISFSTEVELANQIILAFGYESSAKLKNDDAIPAFYNEQTGLLEYFDYSDPDEDELIGYHLTGLYYNKPEKLRFGILFEPKDEIPMSFAFELESIKQTLDVNTNSLNDTVTKTIDLDDVLQWKFGFEYLALKQLPVRIGYIFKTAPFDILNPVSIFTFGTGKDFRNLTIDIAGHYGVLSYKYPDLFPIEGDVREDYDTIKESQLTFITTLQYRF